MTTAQVIGRYQLHGVLASGGMATVHLGRLLGAAGFARTVAIKRLHAQFAQDPEFADMFLDEARLAGRVRHPNVVSVIDVVSTDGEMLLVMEYVQGESLSRLLRRGRERNERVPPPIISAIVCDALDGLHAAHEARDEKGNSLGIVHRDVSPQNIMVGSDGVTRVLDFGIAKASGRSQVTREGQLKGKLSYMAPEQLQGTVTPRTDVHAMGIVLWETLVGARLFAAENEGHTVTKILTGKVSPPSESDPALAPYDAVTMKALAKDPNERYASAREMSIALAACARKAEAHEVAEWLTSVAKDVLDARADAVTHVETEHSATVPHIPIDAHEPVTAAQTRSDLATDAVLPRSKARVPIVIGASILGAALLGLVVVRVTSHDAAPAASPPPPSVTLASAPPPLPSAPATTPTPSATAATAQARAQQTAVATGARPTTPRATSAATATPKSTLPDHL